jgi:hypothetical protein
MSHHTVIEFGTAKARERDPARNPSALLPPCNAGEALGTLAADIIPTLLAVVLTLRGCSPTVWSRAPRALPTRALLPCRWQ